MPTNDLSRGLKELAASREAYESADGYYTGKVSEYFANKSIERSLAGDGKTKFRLPFAAKAVDIPVDLLRVTAVSVDGSDGMSEALRSRVWDYNDLDSDILDVYRNAAKFGDYYVTIWPEDREDDGDETDGEDALDEGEVRDYVEVFMNSPLNMRAIYSRENSRRILFFVKVWEADETDAAGMARWRVNVYYRDRVEQYISKKGAKERPQSGEDFVPYPDDIEVGPDEDDPSIIANEWGSFPCFHFRQGSKPYGTPLHARAFGAQDAITKLNTTHLSTVDYIGYPQRYAILDADAEGEADDDFVEFETSGPNAVDPTSPVEVTRKRSKLRSGPGETWWLEGVKSVGQFDTAGAEPFIEPIKFQTRAMALLTDLPASEFDLDGGGEVPSGESRRQARAGLRSKVETLISSYKPTTEAMLSLALAMLGFPGASVTITFAPLDAMTGKDDWETIETKTKNGVPLRQALAEAGYSEEQIEEWHPSDAPAVSIAQASAIFAAIASAGQAVTLGAATTEDIRAMLGEYLGDDAPEPTRPPLDENDLDLDEPAPATDAGDAEVKAASALKAKADALGSLIRAGVDQAEAAELAGLGDPTFTSVPVSIRVREDEAAGLEDK